MHDFRMSRQRDTRDIDPGRKERNIKFIPDCAAKGGRGKKTEKELGEERGTEGRRCQRGGSCPKLCHGMAQIGSELLSRRGGFWMLRGHLGACPVCNVGRRNSAAKIFINVRGVVQNV